MKPPRSAAIARKRPFVFINMAMTADGKIATSNRAISSFGSKHDHDHLLELRATVDAVMAGARTVDSNAVNLGPGPAKYRRLRTRRGLQPYNLRIIVSRSGTIDPRADIFRHKFSPVIILTSQRALKSRLAALRTVADEVKVFGDDGVDLAAALAWLREAYGVKRLACEGGAELNDGMLRAGLVDEIHVTVTPRVFGGRAAPTIADGQGAPGLDAATPLKLKSARRVGDEMFLVYAVTAPPAADRRGTKRTRRS